MTGQDTTQQDTTGHDMTLLIPSVVYIWEFQKVDVSKFLILVLHKLYLLCLYALTFSTQIEVANFTMHILQCMIALRITYNE